MGVIEETLFSEVYSAYSAIATQRSPLTYSNVYVPVEQSFIYEYYNPNAASVDTWNSAESIKSSGVNLGGADLTDFTDFSFNFTPNGAYYVEDWETAELDGSLAYALDHGTNHYRRTTNWTVVDDVDIFNPLTGEYLLTLPKHLGHTNEYFPSSVTNGNSPNLNAIYKISVNEAEAGGIEITGVDNKSTTNGTVYARYGSNPITGVVTDDESKTLVYAMQSINENIPVRLQPSRITGASSYSIRDDSYNGFTMPSADIEITPVFKTARYITVELTGESAHGSLIPSAEVSAEGEEVTIDVQSDTDYLVTNIQVNGTPVGDFKFFMPDEDVKITAEVVPFKGGITRFSLGGFAGTIDQNRHTVTFTIPRIVGIEHMKPYIEYVGTSVSPSADEYLDFTELQQYTVTYGPDNSTVTYTIDVNMGSYDMRIHDFVVDGVHGDINQARKTINIMLPTGTDLSSIVPDSIAFSAETITPAVDTSVDFNVPRTYTLSADGLNPVTYLVTVTTAAEDAAVLTELRVGGYDAIISEDGKTATINVPKLTDLSNIVPNVVRYIGKTIEPSKLDYLNLEDHDEIYTIQSQNGNEVSYTVHANFIDDNVARIDKFVLAGYEGEIDQERHTITIHVPYGTILNNVAPDCIEYIAAGIYPIKDTQLNFDETPVYTVYAVDGTEVPYTVYVDYDSDARINKFTLLGNAGVIDQDALTITITLPRDMKLDNVVPDEIVWSDGATIFPSDKLAQDFTDSVEYTVTSRTGATERTYTVICNLVDPYDNIITKYTLNGVDGVITNIGETNGTILIEMYLDSTSKYTRDDFNSMIPDIIEYSVGATLNPSEESAQDFVDNDPQYIVTGRTGAKRIYTVHVSFVVPDTTAKITEFKIPDPKDPDKHPYPGVIDEDEKVITITLPPDTDPEDLKDIIPDITWEGKELAPGEDTPQDFTEPIDYTVKAEDPNIENTYTVIVVIEGQEKIYYKVTTESTEGGTVTATPHRAEANKLIEVYCKSQSDYILDVLIVDNEFVHSVDGSYVFSMPAHDVHIKGVFRKVDISDDPELDKTAEITYFEILDTPGVIDPEEKTITIELPPDTDPDDLKDIVPEIIWKGKEIIPGEDTPQDFNNPPDYTVRAEDPTVENTYKIIIKIRDPKPTPPVIPNPRPSTPLSKDAIIIKYVILGVEGDIDQDNGIITVSIPESRRPDGEVSPDEVIYKGYLSPVWDTLISLADENIYTVTAEDPSYSKTYKLVIDWINDLTEEPVDTADTAESEETIDTDSTGETNEPEPEEPETDEPKTDEPETDEPPMIIPGPTPIPGNEDDDEDEDNPPTSVSGGRLWAGLLAILSFGAVLSSRRRNGR